MVEKMTMYEAQNEIQKVIRPFKNLVDLDAALTVAISTIENQGSLAAKAQEQVRDAEARLRELENTIEERQQYAEKILVDTQVASSATIEASRETIAGEIRQAEIYLKQVQDTQNALAVQHDRFKTEVQQEKTRLSQELERLRDDITKMQKEEDRLLRKFGVR